jgi:hypothetical protein
MYVRPRNSTNEFSLDGRSVVCSLPVDTFADVSHMCACPARGVIVLTGVKAGGRVADVSRNARGDYRAYRLNASGIEALTDEYTSSAVPIPDGGIAYSNGGALVIARSSGREVHKVGRFSWGPTSISCSEDGAIVALTKWKGDDRKLAWTKSGEALQVSRFSYQSYVLMGRTAYYALSADICAFDVELAKSKTLTTRALKQRLLRDLGIGRDVDQTILRFGKLSSLDGSLVAALDIQENESFRWLYHGIAAVDRSTTAIRILQKIEEPWHVSNIESNSTTLQVTLDRYENMTLVETRAIALGREQHFLAEGWRMLGHPNHPSFGFQFMPG